MILYTSIKSEEFNRRLTLSRAIEEYCALFLDDNDPYISDLKKNSSNAILLLAHLQRAYIDINDLNREMINKEMEKLKQIKDSANELLGLK